jgi:molybdopterin converting factor small subunit
MTRVDLPVSLHKTIGRPSIDVSGATVAEALKDLVRIEPTLATKVLTDRSELQNFVVAFINGKDIRMKSGLSTPVGENDVITLYIAVAGG